MRHVAKIGLAVVVLSMMQAAAVRADPIPYPNVGTENLTTYTFKAVNTGPITAYFAGTTAGFTNELGLNINGISTGVFGLNNHSASVPVGTSLVLGNAIAGDTLVFVMRNLAPGIGSLYSDASQNVLYDGDGLVHNHVYSTPYLGTNPLFTNIPAGTFVAFEDLPNAGQYSPSNWNYDDEDFVFTNVAVTPAVPVPAAIWGGIVLMGGLISRRGLRRRPA